VLSFFPDLFTARRLRYVKCRAHSSLPPWEIRKASRPLFFFCLRLPPGGRPLIPFSRPLAILPPSRLFGFLMSTSFSCCDFPPKRPTKRQHHRLAVPGSLVSTYDFGLSAGPPLPYAGLFQPMGFFTFSRRNWLKFTCGKPPFRLFLIGVFFRSFPFHPLPGRFSTLVTLWFFCPSWPFDFSTSPSEA